MALAAVLVLLVAGLAAAQVGRPAHGAGPGLVAAAHPVAAAAGTEVLARGGNAVDAAVATAATLGVVEPFGSGIGGGGFLLAYRAADGAALAVDCRETAPAAATPDMFLDPATGKTFARDVLSTGGLPVGVPGQVRCWDEAERALGRLGLAEALRPAIRAAREGFDVTPYFAGEIATHRRRLEPFPESARLFLPGGKPLAVGARFVQPELAATLELLAAQGADAFYAALAPEIAGAASQPRTVANPSIALQPGRMTAADVLAYQARVREPLRGSYHGQRILTHSAPTSGPTLLETLNLLDAYDLGTLGPDSPVAAHLLSEAQRVATADRTRWVGDPDVEAVPCAGLIDPAFAADRRALIAPDSTPTEATPAGDPFRFAAAPCTALAASRAPAAAPTTAAPGCASVACAPAVTAAVPTASADMAASAAIAHAMLGVRTETAPASAADDEEEVGAGTEASGTTHLSVVDGEGNAVAYTSTLALHFGSGIVVPGRGFLLNDTLLDFRANPAAGPSNNLPAPNKRTRSSIAPTLVFDGQGRLRAVLGAAGSAWITPTVAELVVDLVDWNLPPQPAVDRGRFMPADARGGVTLEPALYDGRPDVVAALAGLGHDVNRASAPMAAAQVITRQPETGELAGGADARRDGSVGGGE